MNIAEYERLEREFTPTANCTDQGLEQVRENLQNSPLCRILNNEIREQLSRESTSG